LHRLITQPIAGLVNLGAKTTEGIINTPKTMSETINRAGSQESEISEKAGSTFESTTADHPLHFGQPLENSWQTSLSNQQVHITLLAIDFLKNKGTQTQGLFRIQGSRAKIQEWKSIIDKGQDITFDSSTHPHDVAGLLMSYFRQLPQSLIPEPHWFQVITAEDEPVPRSLEKLTLMIENLPIITKLILLKFLSLLSLVNDFSVINKMTPQNLSVCIGPNIIRSSISLDSLKNSGGVLLPEGVRGTGSGVESDGLVMSALDTIKKTNQMFALLLENWKDIEPKVQ